MYVRSVDSPNNQYGVMLFGRKYSQQKHTISRKKHKRHIHCVLQETRHIHCCPKSDTRIFCKVGQRRQNLRLKITTTVKTSRRPTSISSE